MSKQSGQALINGEVSHLFKKLLDDEKVQQALAFLKEDNDRTTEEQIALTAIPAPTFHEQTRGEEYKRLLLELGIDDVETDETGNVFGVRKGTEDGPSLVVSSHLDTVFPEGTDTVAKEKDGKFFAPGIADNGRGLAAVLTLIRALNHAGILTQGDIIFGATVGEEGLGDLRGVKALFQHRNDLDGFISIEPGPPEVTTYLAAGSRRYKVTYSGPGGHSFGAFGLPSAAHALGRAVAMISEIQVPKEPKTTFNVGTLSGGTTVNTIAAKAEMLLDMRSTSPEELAKLEEKALQMIRQAEFDENARWDSQALKVTIEKVGDRPAGSQSADALIVQASLGADEALGFESVLDKPSSTDSNVPISLGIPALTLGGGGDFDGIHTLGEYFNPTEAYVGPQKILLTMLALVGVEGELNSLLKKNE